MPNTKTISEQTIDIYIQHPKLHIIYANLIEQGVQIVPTVYTKEISDDALCRTSVLDWDNRIFGMSILDNPNLTDDIICHELAHLILLLEGLPVAVPKQNMEGTFEGSMLGYINNMVHHLEVWRLTQALGFPETTRYEQSIRADMLNRMKNLQAFLPGVWIQHPHPIVEPSLLREAYYIASGILCPCLENTKRSLRQTVGQYLPNIAPLVDQLVQACHNALPLSPESALACLGSLIEPLMPPPGSLLPLYQAQPVPAFREKILHEVGA